MSDPIKFTIISQAGFKCPWCEKAVDLLDSKGLGYNLRPLTRSQLLDEADRAKMNTVPIIYHGSKLIGGYTELDAYLSLDIDDEV